MKLSYAASILYFTIAGCTKLGILLMYIRIFFISNGFRTQVIVASTIVLLYWIGCTVVTLLTCRPMSYIWGTASGYPRYCFNYNVFWMAAGVVELLLDLLILALPIRAVISINLSPRRKFSVLGIFLLGGLYV
jgi:cytochrome b561